MYSALIFRRRVQSKNLHQEIFYLGMQWHQNLDLKSFHSLNIIFKLAIALISFYINRTLTILINHFMNQAYESASQRITQIGLTDENETVRQFRDWMKESGCLIHPSIQIPAYFDGVQGIGTKEDLQHKTVIIAIPSKLVITVVRCYNDPDLRSLYKSCDDLFDYESDEDAQFNILCVFLMYHKMNIEKSPWKVYLKTIAEPQTAVSWPDKDLAGLNKSVIEEIIHVRKECKKVEDSLCSFLAKTKQFKAIGYENILKLFRLCYPTVLTRCFGYYFSTACMIPVADLMNHGCETIDHQLIHLNLENDKQFNQTYTIKRNKLNCQLMGLEPCRNKKLPFRLDYLLRNRLIQNDEKALAHLRRKEIDEKIYKFIAEKIQEIEQCEIQKLDFCEQNDEQDNDTNEDEQYSQLKSLQYIRAAEKQQMVEFQKYYLQVQQLAVVEKKIQQQYGPQELNENVKKTSEAEGTELQGQNLKKTQKNTMKQQSVEKSQQKSLSGEQSGKEDKNLGENGKRILQANPNEKNTSQNANKSKIFPIQNMLPLDLKQQQSESSGSEQEEWCLEESCYFTMSTHGPVSARSQLFNSYGSRTNKFLLVWYGFCYPNNLYDSVTLRLQANFPSMKPKGSQILLDTYVGGQGLCFKKNEEEYVQANQVSRQFRLKRTRLPLQLLMFLRLLLIPYYKKGDNYKILTTLPSSFDFELQLFYFFKEIVQELYKRYPKIIIEALKQELEEQIDKSRRSRIKFKIIYLEEQRKILDENIEAIVQVIKIIEILKESRKFEKKLYSNLKVEVVRKIRQYLVQVKTNFSYILYSQFEKVDISKVTQQEDNEQGQQHSIT